MADIELVIKISEDSYKATCNGWMLPPDVENVVQGIKNGKVLPKGHGRLIDADAFIKFLKHKEYGMIDYSDCVIDDITEDASTIIEADKGDE